jgi:hypothetical protein
VSYPNFAPYFLFQFLPPIYLFIPILPHDIFHTFAFVRKSQQSQPLIKKANFGTKTHEIIFLA